MSSRSGSEELRVVAPLTAEQREILSPEALAFVGKLMRRFGPPQMLITRLPVNMPPPAIEIIKPNTSAVAKFQSP